MLASFTLAYLLNRIFSPHLNSNNSRSSAVEVSSSNISEYVDESIAVIVRFPVPVVLNWTVQFPPNGGYECKFKTVIDIS